MKLNRNKKKSWDLWLLISIVNFDKVTKNIFQELNVMNKHSLISFSRPDEKSDGQYFVSMFQGSALPLKTADCHGVPTARLPGDRHLSSRNSLHFRPANNPPAASSPRVVSRKTNVFEQIGVITLREASRPVRNNKVAIFESLPLRLPVRNSKLGETKRRFRPVESISEEVR